MIYSGPRDVSIRNVDDPARHLRNLIHPGSATPSFIVSHRLGLDPGADAYRRFDGRDDGCTKVILKLGRRNGAPAL